jgi:hypothetical protein
MFVSGRVLGSDIDMCRRVRKNGKGEDLPKSSFHVKKQLPTSAPQKSHRDFVSVVALDFPRQLSFPQKPDSSAIALCHDHACRSAAEDIQSNTTAFQMSNLLKK